MAEALCTAAGGAYHGLGTACATAVHPIVAVARLVGTVRSAADGTAIVGADVTLSGVGTTTTNDQGEYAFSDVMPGEIDLTASKAGFTEITESVTVLPSSRIIHDLALPPGTSRTIKPVVTQVKGKYCGPNHHVYYFTNVTLTETFTATVNWNGLTPHMVEFKSPNGSHYEHGSGTSFTSNFNMGSAFPLNGKLTVIAEAANGQRSDPKVANFDMLARPNHLSHATFVATPVGNTLKYHTESISGSVPYSQQHGASQLPETINGRTVHLLGKNPHRYGTGYWGKADVTDNGIVNANLQEYLAESYRLTKMGGRSRTLKNGGPMKWTYQSSGKDRSGGSWLPTGSTTVGAYFEENIPPIPLYFFIGPVPIYFQGHLEVGLQAHFVLDHWQQMPSGWWVPVWRVTIDLDPFPYAEGDVGCGINGVCSLEGYLGVRLAMVVEFPNPDPIQAYRVGMCWGARFEFLFHTYDLWNQTENWNLINWARGADAGYPPPVLRLAPRDYLASKQGYAVFVANDRIRGPRNGPTTEFPLQLNVYPKSAPDLVALGNDLLVVWLHDDPTRTRYNRTEVVYSRYDAASQTWSAPVAVADDGTADFGPKLAVLPNGDALLAWANVKEAIVEPGEPNDACAPTCQTECEGEPDPNCLEHCLTECKFAELKSKMEIVVAQYSAALGQWAAPVVLTSNEYIDHSPMIAAAPDGTALVAWISNATGEIFDTPGAASDLRYARFDGLGWTTGDIATNVPSIWKSALAHKSTEAVLVFSADTDGNTSTVDDRELMATTFDGLAWSGVTQITSNAVEDNNPQLAYDPSGTLLLVWYNGGDVLFADNLALAGTTAVVDRDETPHMGAADFRLATAGDGRRALSWQDTSAGGVDTSYVTFDAGAQAWSKPQTLSAEVRRDAAMDWAFAPAFTADGELVIVYNRVQLGHQTVQAMDEFGDIMDVSNVPYPIQTDLYCLRRQLVGDLAVSADGIGSSTPNPAGGELAALSATVRNVGDKPMSDVEVVFYDGPPGTPQSRVIGRGLVPGLLRAGDQAAVKVPWLVPDLAEARDLYVVIDPNGVQPDSNLANNTAVSPDVMTPDPYIESVGADSISPTDRVITVRVGNVAGLSASGLTVTLRRDAPDGELLATLPIADTVAALGYYDVSWVWSNAAPFPAGWVEVFAIVNAGKPADDFDPNNNVRSVILRNEVVEFDCNENGYSDTYDIAAGTSLDCNSNVVPDECDTIDYGDFNADSQVDFADYVELEGTLAGPGSAPNVSLPACLPAYLAAFDFDGDADLDLADFASFQTAYGG